MARLTIPNREREGLSKLLALPADAFAQLMTQLQSLPANLDLPSKITRGLVAKDIPRADLDQIGSAILSVCLVKWLHDVSLDVFVADLTEAILSFNVKAGSDESKQRLQELLNIEPLRIASKAFTIFTDYQCTLFGSKVLTDVRYVFRANPEEEPYGAVIVHLLKLSYHESGGHKEFFVAMDDDDVATLQDVLKRATTKAASLRAKLDASNTRYLGSSNPHKKGESNSG